jgi:hypothetical protein
MLAIAAHRGNAYSFNKCTAQQKAPQPNVQPPRNEPRVVNTQKETRAHREFAPQPQRMLLHRELVELQNGDKAGTETYPTTNQEDREKQETPTWASHAEQGSSISVGEGNNKREQTQ